MGDDQGEEKRLLDLCQEYRKRLKLYLWLAVVAVPAAYLQWGGQVKPLPSWAQDSRSFSVVIAVAVQALLLGLAARMVNLLIDYNRKPKKPKKLKKLKKLKKPLLDPPSIWHTWFYEVFAYIALGAILWAEFVYVLYVLHSEFLWGAAIVWVVFWFVVDIGYARGPRELAVLYFPPCCRKSLCRKKYSEFTRKGLGVAIVVLLPLGIFAYYLVVLLRRGLVN